MRALRKMHSNLLLCVAMGYVGLLVGSLAYHVLVPQERQRESRAFFLQHALRIAEPLLQESRTQEATIYLKEAIATGLIDFFEIDTQAKPPERMGTGPDKRPVLPEKITQVDGWIWGKAETAHASLWIASGFGWRWRLAQAWEAERSRVAQHLFFLFLTFWLVLVLVPTVRRERSLGQAGGSAGAERSASWRIGRHASRGEKGRKAEPVAMEITGACGRTALANYDEIAGKQKDAAFFAALDSFFTECASLIGRYQGKLHAVQGHEILYYFPGKDSVHQARLALAAAHDLEQIAEARGFRLVTALAEGLLHGGQVFSSFTLLGAPLEETAELVQARTGSGKNVIWVSEKIVKLVGRMAHFRQVPGSGKNEVRHALVKLPKVEEVLKGCGEASCEELAFHRGDDAIVQVLEMLRTAPSWSRESYIAVIGVIRQYYCLRSGEEVANSYRALLQQELQQKDSYRLSSTLALAPHVLNRAYVGSALEKLFLQAVALKDRRVRANAVELFIHFYPDREVQELRPLVRDDDNRVSANALVKAALERFDERVIARIEERVRGGSVAHVASALYALGEIAAHYRKSDPLFLGTKTGFLRIFHDIPVWVLHPNPMIRRQALHAAKKLSDPALDAKLQAIFERSGDLELRELFSSIYGWNKSSPRAA